MRVVEIEGPIHPDEVARRVTALWGLQRTGARIVESISKAIHSGLGSGVLQADQDFLTLCQHANMLVRDRSQVMAVNLRKPEMIAPAEIRQAIVHLVAEQVGVRRDEVPSMVARVFGFKVVSAKLRDVIEKVLERLLEENAIAVREQKLFTP